MSHDLIGEEPSVSNLSHEYSEAQNQQLSQNLGALYRDITGGLFSSTRVDLTLLEDLHARLFRDVTDHVGRIRRHNWGSEYLVFGPNRSEHRDDVIPALTKYCEQVNRSRESLDGNEEDPDYESSSFQLAAYAHAELVRIHPFQDGNGRCSRAITDLILVRLGFSPIAINAIRDEYYAALNQYHGARDLDPFCDLLLRCWVTQHG